MWVTYLVVSSLPWCLAVGKSCHSSMMARWISSSGGMTNLPERLFHMCPSMRSTYWVYPCSVISQFRSWAYLFWAITIRWAREPSESSFATQIVVGWKASLGIIWMSWLSSFPRSEVVWIMSLLLCGVCLGHVGWWSGSLRVLSAILQCIGWVSLETSSIVSSYGLCISWMGIVSKLSMVASV
jgi:hypothetical protein